MEKKKAFSLFCETLNKNSSYVFNKIKCFNNKFSKLSSYNGNRAVIESMKNSIDEICSPGKMNLLKNLILFIYNLIWVRHIQFINYPSNIVLLLKDYPKVIF